MIQKQMGFYAALLCAMLFFPLPANAEGQEGETTMQPICFEIQNKAPYAVFGTLVTSTYTTPEGIKARHHENFRLQKDHFAQFCSSGPFYPGRMLDIQIKTLVPVFECLTAINGPVVIRGQIKPDGKTETTVDCLKP